MSALDALRAIGMLGPGFLLAGIFVYAVTASWPQAGNWPFPNPRRSSLWALAALSLGLGLLAALFVLLSAQRGTSGGETRHYDAGLVLNQVLVALIAFGPALLTMRVRREPWGSVGVTRHNLGRAAGFGLVLSSFAVAIVLAGNGRSLVQVVGGFQADHLWALPHFAVVGLGEEFAFRGYLQTRLVAWLGRWPGWIAASVLMALAHIPQRMTMMGFSPGEALLSSVELVPISLFMGYILLRSENLAAPALLHIFIDWVNTV